MNEFFKNVLIVVLALLVVSLSIVGLKEYSSKNEWKDLAGAYEVNGQVILNNLNDKDSIIQQLSLCLNNNDYVTSYTVINKTISDVRCRGK